MRGDGTAAILMPMHMYRTNQSLRNKQNCKMHEESNETCNLHDGSRISAAFFDAGQLRVSNANDRYGRSDTSCCGASGWVSLLWGYRSVQVKRCESFLPRLRRCDSNASISLSNNFRSARFGLLRTRDYPMRSRLTCSSIIKEKPPRGASARRLKGVHGRLI